ncbi:terminase large subunit [Romboutsia weinsteinii]|uniref:Terminase large subunit n=1 Tax=Romboutsia weinsteinii TaxID=2020949 RepID=A0A371JAL1_9FIRM|nr:terminase TerL endonuclease subunit [Romboutsia weinsteinii]RDY29753.1 terminase large subunit [Romboutsia weinsteinii]
MFDNRVYETTAYKYCKRVATGKVPSNKWMILFANKFIKDIERSKDEDFPYFFDVEKAFFIEEFIYQLKYTEGLKVGENIVLASFQSNIVQNAFCWRLKEDKSIYRYREVIVYLPRKQGKSYIISLLGLIGMMLEQNAQVYNGASKLAQAQILVNMAINLVKSNPELAEHFKIYKKYLEFDGSIFNAVSSNAISQDGINPSTIMLDESMVVDRALRDSLTSGFLMRKNYQTFMISTEYDVQHEDNWFVEMLDYGKKVLEGTFEDERILPIMYCLDNPEEIHNQDLWIKACPILEEIPAKPIENEYKKALENPKIMKNLLIKQFNVPQITSEDNSYLIMDKWKALGVDKIDFEGKEVHIGVDLSLTTDISAVSMMYKEDGKYFIKSVGFIPEESLIGRREKFDYKLSASKGELFIREGMIVDYDFIEDYIRNIEKEYKCKIKSINFDPYNAVNMMLSLSNDYDVVEIRQSMTNLSSPTKELRNEVYLGNIVYEKSMLFDWCVSNAITRIDKSENEMLDKSKSKNRIDLLVATVFAFKSAYEVEEKPKFSIDDIFMI